MKDLDQHMKDFIIQGFPNMISAEIGKGALTGDVIRDAGIGPISSSSVLIMEYRNKLLHRLVSIDVSKKIQQKQTHGIITGRTGNRIQMRNQRPNKREIYQRTDHPGIAALYLPIGEDPNKAFFKPVM